MGYLDYVSDTSRAGYSMCSCYSDGAKKKKKVTYSKTAEFRASTNSMAARV